mmetsp:Transcript_6656/g.21167  ORF Transcript_6656/g.21167 Transcript_6656/m.21167 type:complete len:283 (-) Transcript_6656:237-1085(-)
MQRRRRDCPGDCLVVPALHAQIAPVRPPTKPPSDQLGPQVDAAQRARPVDKVQHGGVEPAERLARREQVAARAPHRVRRQQPNEAALVWVVEHRRGRHRAASVEGVPLDRVAAHRVARPNACRDELRGRGGVGGSKRGMQRGRAARTSAAVDGKCSVDGGGEAALHAVVKVDGSAARHSTEAEVRVADPVPCREHAAVRAAKEDRVAERAARVDGAGAPAAKLRRQGEEQGGVIREGLLDAQEAKVGWREGRGAKRQRGAVVAVLGKEQASAQPGGEREERA